MTTTVAKGKELDLFSMFETPVMKTPATKSVPTVKTQVVKKTETVLAFIERKSDAKESAGDPPNDPPKKETRRKNYPPVIGIVWLFISAGCVLNTIHNIAGFMSNAGASVLFAVLTAILVSIVTSIFAYTASLKKEWRVILYAVGLPMMVFSVFCTIAVNYASMKETDAAYALAIRYDNETAELEKINETAIQDANVDKARLEQEIALKTADAEYWKTRIWRKYDEIQTSVKETETQLKEIRLAKSKLLEEKRDIAARKSGNAEIKEKTAFVFLSEITGMKDNAIKFLVLLISGLFYDLTAPIAFALGFSMIVKGDKNE